MKIIQMKVAKILTLKKVRIITFASAIHLNPNSKHNSYRNIKNQIRRKKEYLNIDREHDHCIS